MDKRETCIQEVDVRGRGRLDWVVKIESEVENEEILRTRERDVRREHTIYKIPEGFVSDDKRIQAYKPQVVSMGPYHHGEEKLLPMEEHKRRALRQFLVRTKRGVREYREALSGVVQELMDSYKDLENEWKDDEERFLQLMIFDGCFMIELFRMEDVRAHGGSTPTGYDEDDPIFGRQGMFANMPRIGRDMLMIENQIPLLVLKILLSVEQGVVDDHDEHDMRQKQQSLNKEVNNMVLAFFGVEAKYSVPDHKELGLHALDLVRKSMIKVIKGGERGRTETSNDVIWPATQLRQAGIKIRKSSRLGGRLRLNDVDFSPGYPCATLRLPQLVVEDDTEYKFLNLMAFEHLHVGSGNEISSYVSFMALIIDSEKDVSLLSRKDIIKNFVGADRAVADLFHRISRDVSIDPNSNIMAVHQKVTTYCDTRMAKAAYFCGNFFFSACVWISSSLGIVFLVTCLQLVYAMLDFYQKPNP